MVVMERVLLFMAGRWYTVGCGLLLQIALSD